MPKTKRNLTLEERRSIRDRLERFRARHYRNQQAMNRDAGLPPGTASGWFHPEPATPDTVSLVRIAERKNLNLNWLLLGEGPELRGVDAETDVWNQLRQTLVAELVSHGAERADADRMIPQPDALFHFLMVEMLEGWMRVKDWQRIKHGRRPSPKISIARALERSLAGLDPIPTRKRLRRRPI